MIITKKISTPYFNEILSGKKNFELRLNDFDCKEGDVLVLKEIDEGRNYTGREIRKNVKYVLKTNNLNFFKISDIEKYGYQVIGF